MKRLKRIYNTLNELNILLYRKLNIYLGIIANIRH